MSAAISTSERIAIADSLLAQALERLSCSVISDIKSFSDIDDRGIPVPGTVDPDFVEFIVDDLALIRAIDSHLGLARPPRGPTWFDDLIEGRGAWEGSPL